jgi:hypothetical protein
MSFESVQLVNSDMTHTKVCRWILTQRNCDDDSDQ